MRAVVATQQQLLCYAMSSAVVLQPSEHSQLTKCPGTKEEILRMSLPTAHSSTFNRHLHLTFRSDQVGFQMCFTDDPAIRRERHHSKQC